MPPDRRDANNTSDSAPRNRVNTKGKRSRSRGRNTRRVRRLIAEAVSTSAELQGTSRQRQRTRAAGEANLAAGLDRQVENLRETFNGNKRDIFATGLVPDGTEFRGNTRRYK